MSDFQITYRHPWLLLLIIPAVLLTLIPYFRLHKRYRFTRNRIGSMVLHIAATVLAANLLAGLGFSYSIPNDKNEVIILVDVSDSGAEEREMTDEFVRSVIDVCPDGCKIGIVKFGYGCSYPVSLTDNREGAFAAYAASEDPSGTASALADALKYTASLFTNKKTSKIVVVSDGLETDGDALLSLYEIASEGTVIDTAYVSSDDAADVRIVSAEIKDKEIMPGQSFN